MQGLSAVFVAAGASIASTGLLVFIISMLFKISRELTTKPSRVEVKEDIEESEDRTKAMMTGEIQRCRQQSIIHKLEDKVGT
jgi:hypothetical protein